jgi:hypothetical protein
VRVSCSECGEPTVVLRRFNPILCSACMQARKTASWAKSREREDRTGVCIFGPKNHLGRKQCHTHRDVAEGGAGRCDTACIIEGGTA